LPLNISNHIVFRDKTVFIAHFGLPYCSSRQAGSSDIRGIADICCIRLRCWFLAVIGD